MLDNRSFSQILTNLRRIWTLRYYRLFNTPSHGAASVSEQKRSVSHVDAKCQWTALRRAVDQSRGLGVTILALFTHRVAGNW